MKCFIGRLDKSTAATIGMWTDKANVAISDTYAAHVKDLYEELALWDDEHFHQLQKALPKAQEIFMNGEVCLGTKCLAYHKHTQECRNCPYELDQSSHIIGRPCASLHAIDLSPPNESSIEVVRRLYKMRTDDLKSDGCFILHGN
jgi:hypothetical protein